MCALIGGKSLDVCFPLSGVTYLPCLPEQKEFLWEHQSDENKKRELQVCIRGPGSQEQDTDCPEAVVWACLGQQYVHRGHRDRDSA